MSFEGANETPQCVDCAKVAPGTHTSYTLISKVHGWRLDRRYENGNIVLAWRCRECWQRFKARQEADK